VFSPHHLATISPIFKRDVFAVFFPFVHLGSWLIRMNKNYVLSLGKLSLLVSAAYGLSACMVQQTKSPQPELVAMQQSLVTQEAQSKRVEQQQQDILASLSQVQSQLIEQQKVLETRPQVIEKTVKINCPPIPATKAPTTKIKDVSLSDKQIVGLREQVLINGSNMTMPARISTNVANSVLDARNMQMFERNGEEWVRFTMYNPTTKEPHVLERKRLRFQSVPSNGDTTDRRPVVEMRFTIGKLTQKGEFILADRTDSEYPVLIGRNLLRDVMLVDVSGNNLAPLQIKDESTDSAAPAKP